MRMIDADYVIGEMDRRKSFLIADQYGDHPITLEVIMDFIKEVRTVDQVKHGHWVFSKAYVEDYVGIGKVMDLLRMHGKDPIEADFDSMYCSCCAEGFNMSDNYDTDRFDYCPKCGAKMDEEVIECD